MKKVNVAIIMGSISDLPIMKEAAKVLEEFKVEHSVSIISAHRTPKKMYTFAKEAEKKQIKVIIAGAGGSAHLPGITASLTNIPVIGVPIKTKSLDGLDSLLSIVQMPPGVPVATVGINGAKNAGLLAAKIMGLSDIKVAQKLDDFSSGQEKNVLELNEKLVKNGWKKYLSEK